MKKWSDTRAPGGRIAYVNGRYLPHGQAMVHIEDRALQLGDGIYEVTSVIGFAPIDEEAHLDRMERSLRELGIAMPMGRPALKLVMRQMIARNRLADGLLYLQVTRGAVRRDHVPPKDPPRPTLIMTMRAQDMTALAARMDKGIAVSTQPDIRWGRCDIKTVQLLPNLLAKQAAKAAGAFEAWLVDRDGYVTEGASTNAWIVDQDGTVVTRDLSNAILPGVTRRIMLEAMAEGQVKVAERKFTLTDALNAREAFISSATGAAVPVVSIDGKVIGNGAPGPLTQRIYALYAARAGIK
ncbi:MAG: D-amino acid aminotransferase [Alphaproteobacteria bacterium 64-11]|nr:D-amino-acid transaminase [Alphaproteobacteria bacterium]OJU11240.1 MAG: D-amino acid aminotransferase [Alphaproteobacteria bacterium 64-11]